MNKEDLKSFVLPLIGVNPLFLVIWGDGYYGVKDKAKCRNVDLGHFSIDNGYDEDDILKASRLELGQSFTLDSGTCTSSVVRIA